MGRNRQTESQGNEAAASDNVEQMKQQLSFLNTVAPRMAVYEIAQSLAESLKANLQSVDTSNIHKRVNDTKRGKS